MKTMLSVIICLFVMASVAQAQMEDVSNVLTQIADGIKPEAFNGKFNKNKDEWKDKVAAMDVSDLSAVTGQVGGLLKGLKGSSLAGVAKKELLKSLANVSSLSDIGGLLSSLVKGLDPSMLTEAFASNRDSLTDKLEMLGS
ncbi:MAG: hypothetical protein ACFB15_19205 [Cyclobacteriaceae bacterium]